MRLKEFPSFTKVVRQVMPVDSDSQAQGGNYNFVSLRHYNTITAFIAVGAHSGASKAITLQQAKNVEGNSAKTLAFSRYYKQTVGASPPETGDRWDLVTGVSSTFNIAAQHHYAIPIRQAMLDVTNDFDCVRIHLAAPAAATLIYMAFFLMGGPEGIGNDVRHIPSANVNNMQD